MRLEILNDPFPAKGLVLEGGAGLSATVHRVPPLVSQSEGDGVGESGGAFGAYH